MKNRQLYTSLCAFTRKIFDDYDKHCTENENFFARYFGSDSDVIYHWDEYKSALAVLNSTPEVTSLFNQEIRSGNITGVFRNANDLLINICSKYKDIYKTYRARLFDLFYIEFEKFIFNHLVLDVFSVQLYNFSYTSNESIIINDELQIVYSPYEAPIDDFTGKSSFWLRCSIYKKFVVSSQTSSLPNPFTEALSIFSRVINSLRLIKKCNVYLDEAISHVSFNPLDPHISLEYGTSRHKPYLYGNSTTFSDNELLALKLYYEYLSSSKTNSRFTTALSRLSFATERGKIIDKLIDLMIALEAIYLPDGNQELTFRLSLRAALVLNDRVAAKPDYSFLKKMYKERSSIVHGSESNITINDIDHLEELVRKSLKLYVSDESKFSKDELDAVFFE